MTVCNRCGKENQDHYKFCLGCGAELTAPKAPGGDVAMMKTMMQDPTQGAAPGAPLRGSSSQMPQPNRGMPGMPPSGPLGAGGTPGMGGMGPGPMGPGPMGPGPMGPGPMGGGPMGPMGGPGMGPGPGMG